MGKSQGGSLLETLALPSTHPTLHIVMLGLDSAGKTTALYRLKFDQYVNTVRSLRSLLARNVPLLTRVTLLVSGTNDRLQLREDSRPVRQGEGHPIPSLGRR